MRTPFVNEMRLENEKKANRNDFKLFLTFHSRVKTAAIFFSVFFKWKGLVIAFELGTSPSVLYRNAYDVMVAHLE